MPIIIVIFIGPNAALPQAFSIILSARRTGIGLQLNVKHI